MLVMCWEAMAMESVSMMPRERDVWLSPFLGGWKWNFALVLELNGDRKHDDVGSDEMSARISALKEIIVRIESAVMVSDFDGGGDWIDEELL
jgi:hypothetical protein